MTIRRRFLFGAGVAAIALGTAVSAVNAAVNADVEHARVVSPNPVDTTPHVLDGAVRALAEVGGKVVVGGDFSQVRQADRQTVYGIKNIFAYDKRTGAIDLDFRPGMDGAVTALQAGTGGTVYAAGAFTTVNGATGRGLVRLRLSDGSAVPSFRGQIAQGAVDALIRRGNHLYVGGTFRRIGGRNHTAIARLDARTGVADPNFAVTPAGSGVGGSARVSSIAVDPLDEKVVFAGDFTAVNGRPRARIALLEVTHTSAGLSGWATNRYATGCDTSGNRDRHGGRPGGHGHGGRISDIDFDPAGTYFVAVTTGGAAAGPALCGTAARWNAKTATTGQQPAWVNRTGGDDLLSVSVTGVAVYVAGNQRWQDNALGAGEDPGPGAISRPGIAALNPDTGRTLSWNPTRSRGRGAEALIATADGGLLVGSDTEQLGREYHARVGMFPTGP